MTRPILLLIAAAALLAASPDGPPGPPTVRTYGARGDGAADDTAAIRKAIAAARKGEIPEVVFPPGTYRVTSTLTLGEPYGQPAGATAGLRLRGPGGVGAGRATSRTQAVLAWDGDASGMPLLEVRQAWGTSVEGLAFDGGGKASACVRVLHAPGDRISNHLVTFARCTFQNARDVNVWLAGSPPAGSSGDNCCVGFDDCLFTAMPGGVPTSTTAHVRGDAGSILPATFANCEFTGDRKALKYHLQLSGGSYNLIGGLMSAASVAAISMTGTDEVPPDVTAIGIESQGDRAFLVAEPRGKAAPMRATTLVGVYVGGDGGLTPAADSIRWGMGPHSNLTLAGVRLERNLNIADPTALVFASGLQFTDVSGDVTGNVGRLVGSWAKAGRVRTQAVGTLVVGTARSDAEIPPGGVAWVGEALRARTPAGALRTIATGAR